MSRSDQDAIWDVQDSSEVPSGCPAVVWRPSQILVVGMPSRMSGSGRRTLSDVREWWEAISDVREWSGGPPKCPGVIKMPSGMSRIGRKTLADVRE